MPSTSKRKRIMDLPLASRPREKLLAQGRQNLSNAELIAVLFGTGNRKHNAVALSETLLKKFPLEVLDKVTYQQLIRIPGIGHSKATRIAAAIELGERMFAPRSLTKVTIQATEEVVAQVKEYADKQQEYLVALYLNARHELLQKEIIGIGTLNSMQIEPKEIFRPALLSPCAALIVAHNHPSGDPTPSDNDISFTKRVLDAGEVLGIPLLDHVIVSRTAYFSFCRSEDRVMMTG